VAFSTVVALGADAGAVVLAAAGGAALVAGAADSVAGLLAGDALRGAAFAATGLVSIVGLAVFKSAEGFVVEVGLVSVILIFSANGWDWRHYN
jgi:hypothetical protein